MRPTRDFKGAVQVALKKRLGADALTLPLDELVARLTLPVSRETLRKILKGGYAPKPAVRAALLNAITLTPLPTDRGRITADAFQGFATTSEIRGLLTRDSASGSVRASTNLRPMDFVLESVTAFPTFFRCLDDEPGEGLMPVEYYQTTLNEMAAEMGLHGAAQGALITHTTPSAPAQTTAGQVRIRIHNYLDFIRSIVALDAVERSLQEKLAKRGLLGNFLPLPMMEVTASAEKPCGDSYARLLAFLEDSKGVSVATLIGSFGSGKTSLALTVAHDVLQRSAGSPRRWILPIWASARLSEQLNSASSLDQELADALRALAPKTLIGADTLKRLVSSGQAWLFVDGLDESLVLRSRERLHGFINSLLDYCHPNGRLILSVRQEIFDDRNEELTLLASQVQDSGAANTLVLRTQSLERTQIERIIRSRLGESSQSAANRLLADIQKSQAVQDLVTRPIFLHILLTAGGLPAAPTTSGATRELFEKYVEQWVEEEQRRTVRLDLPSDQRLKICELMALYATRYGENGGVSASEIEKIARDLGKSISIRNIDAFIAEARVAMFLERAPGADRFSFSHRSLRSFFVARRIGREIGEQRDFRSLESIPLRQDDRLLPFFLLETLRLHSAFPRKLLEETLDDAVHGDWNSWNVGRPSPFRLGPCFSYLVPNLTTLLLQLREDTPGDSSPIDLQGAHLAKLDLDGMWGKHPRLPLLLDAANLEGTTLSGPINDDRGIPPGVPVRATAAKRYCDMHDLLAPPRFSTNKLDRFVLIPAGEYMVANHKADSRENRFARVTLRSYLIERYPVTNRQFLAFLQLHSEYRPPRVREETANPYYLLQWPESDDPRLADQAWLDRPVVHVNWEAAAAFASASGLRLPTEVEWEVASRYTGTDVATTLRPWGEHIDKRLALYWDVETGDDVLGTVADTGVRSPSLWPERTVYELLSGFEEWSKSRDVPYHMVDFVREWVADTFDSTYPCESQSALAFSYLNDGYAYDRAKDRWRPSDERQVLRVLRGGSFQTGPDSCSSEYRAAHPQRNVNPDVGFRCVRPLRVPQIRGA